MIEADEYDSAFFDKRPKFMHYRPHIALLNNLEFDHADIYDSVEDIIRQFHYLLRLIPSEGHVIARADSPALQSAFDMGVYCPIVRFGGGSQNASSDIPPSADSDIPLSAEWQWEYAKGRMTVLHRGCVVGEFAPPLLGAANRDNIIGAFAAAAAAGINEKKIGGLCSGL